MNAKGLVENERISDGRYRLVFTRDVSRCAFTASFNTRLAPDMVAVSPRPGEPKAAEVWIEDAGNASDQAFSVLVNC